MSSTTPDAVPITVSAPKGHGLDVSRARWNPDSGALELHCECGYVVRDFPPSHRVYDDKLEVLEGSQISRFRRHLEEVAHG